MQTSKEKPEGFQTMGKKSSKTEQKKISSEFKVSETTANWIRIKIELSDLFDRIVDTYQSVFNEIPDGDYEKISDAICEIDDILNTYMAYTIEANLTFKESRSII